jgi:hypothetical protein
VWSPDALPMLGKRPDMVTLGKPLEGGAPRSFLEADNCTLMSRRCARRLIGDRAHRTCDRPRATRP